MKSLYAYFGLLDLHTIDSPGHSLYQLGLIDSLRESYGDTRFDFYSYYPEMVVNSTIQYEYPDGELGAVFTMFKNEMFDDYLSSLEETLKRIEKKYYGRLYLKARFRNLSTLSKKWKDARDFERMVESAISSGYEKHQIIILDTDLSLPESFVCEFKEKVTILTPSIDFPGISNRFLEQCAITHVGKFNRKLLNCVFYGNIDTSNYKSGNSKDAILSSVLRWCDLEYSRSGLSQFIVICKENEKLDLDLKNSRVARHDRLKIWKTLEASTIMLNVTKDKYNDKKFIPARIYEALIFGMIPVSYKFNFLCPAFSFENLEDLEEIVKYLKECSLDDLEKAYFHFIKNYKSHVETLTKRII
jgi:hypothetical protein